MKAGAKISLYSGLVLGVVVLGCLYAHEHTLVARAAAGMSHARMVGYLVGLLAVGLALATILILDLVHFFRSRAEEWLLQSGEPGDDPPELQEAQRVRAAGEPLDAIRLLREYLEANPREVRVMGRIAEIYNHDLRNYLAAALEYEELLKHKLPPEEWGWGALHLAKIYGKMNELDKSLALLDRLENEYGQTVAAQRARKVMGTGSPEPGDSEESRS